MTSPLNLQRAVEFVTALVFDNNADNQKPLLDKRRYLKWTMPGEPEVLPGPSQWGVAQRCNEPSHSQPARVSLQWMSIHGWWVWADLGLHHGQRRDVWKLRPDKGTGNESPWKELRHQEEEVQIYGAPENTGAEWWVCPPSPFQRVIRTMTVRGSIHIPTSFTGNVDSWSWALKKRMDREMNTNQTRMRLGRLQKQQLLLIPRKALQPNLKKHFLWFWVFICIIMIYLPGFF